MSLLMTIGLSHYLIWPIKSPIRSFQIVLDQNNSNDDQGKNWIFSQETNFGCDWDHPRVLAFYKI